MTTTTDPCPVDVPRRCRRCTPSSAGSWRTRGCSCRTDRYPSIVEWSTGTLRLMATGIRQIAARDDFTATRDEPVAHNTFGPQHPQRPHGYARDGPRDEAIYCRRDAGSYRCGFRGIQRRASPRPTGLPAIRRSRPLPVPGQHYTVWYSCTQYTARLPYGTANSPPLGGSAAQPGGDGPTVGAREPGWARPGCPMCSS